MSKYSNEFKIKVVNAYLLGGAFFMSKYSNEFKIKVVNAYLLDNM